MNRYKLLSVIFVLVLALLLAACGGSEATPKDQTTPSSTSSTDTSTETSAGKLEILEATFAHGLDDNMGPVDPGNQFQPDETVYLSIKLKGKPKEGVVSARFMYGDQEIAEASVDLAEAWKEEGLIFAIGGNTQVGFTLSHDQPFPPGDEYVAKVYLNGKPVDTYAFEVVGENASAPAETEGTTSLEILEATFAHGLDDNMGPVDPGNQFQPDETIYLSIKLKGKPKEGVVSARFMYGDQEIAKASVDLAEAWKQEGAVFAIGGNAQVGFTLTHDQPFPVGDAYKAEVYLNGELAETYPFQVVGEGGSATTPSGEHTVTIHALWYATDASGKAFGGVSPVRVSVRPSQNKELRVGFFEEEVGGLGPMWRAAGWTAVVVASQLLGIDPRDYEFAYSVGGRIDGPSAGAYMTVATLAALQGHDVAPDIFMTGTINPDGTIGPVGGIPQKIEGAAENGARMVLIPAGLRYDYDAATGKQVDVVEKGRQLGVEVREVSTIFDAYQLLTGQPLPRPQVTGGSPELPPRAFDRTRAKAQEWMARYQDARGRFNSLAPEIVNFFSDEIANVDQAAVRADSALQQGLAAVAYSRAVEATVQAQVLLLLGEMIQRYAATQDVQSLADYLIATQSTLTEQEAVLDLLQTENPRSASDYVALFDAYTSIGQAQGLIVLANDAIQKLVNNAANMSDEDFIGQLMEISAYYVLAKDFVQLARDSVDIGFGYGQEQEIPQERIDAMAELLRHASDANLDYFDSVIVQDLADAWSIHPNVARQLLMSYDWSYLFVEAASAGVEALSAGLGDPAEATRLKLGSSVSNYALTSALLAKHYALGAQLDQDGNIVAISRERALADMLDLADQRARELIALNGDDVPVMAVLYYENARLERQGGPEEQLSALQDYWSAATLATVQAYLSGRFGQ